MPFCIKKSSYDPNIHDIVDGPHFGGCNSCVVDPENFTSSSGIKISLSSYLDPSLPINVYTGATGDTMVVPQGYNYAVYIDSSGNVTYEEVFPGQTLTFRSDIALGSAVTTTTTPCPEDKIYRDCSKRCEYKECNTYNAEVGMRVWDEQLCRCGCIPAEPEICAKLFGNPNLVANPACLCSCRDGVKEGCKSRGLTFTGDDTCSCNCESDPMVRGRLDKCPAKALDEINCVCECEKHYGLAEGRVYSLNCNSICPQQRGAGPFEWYSERLGVGEYQDLLPFERPPCPDKDGKKGLFDTSICECIYPCAEGDTVELCKYNGDEYINCIQPCPSGQVLLPCKDGHRLCGCADAPNGSKRHLESVGSDSNGNLVQKCVCDDRGVERDITERNRQYPNCSNTQYEDNETCECTCAENSVNEAECASWKKVYDASTCSCVSSSSSSSSSSSDTCFCIEEFEMSLCNGQCPVGPPEWSIFGGSPHTCFARRTRPSIAGGCNKANFPNPSCSKYEIKCPDPSQPDLGCYPECVDFSGTVLPPCDGYQTGVAQWVLNTGGGC